MAKKKTNAWWRKKCVELAKETAKKRDRYRCQRCKCTRSAGYQIHGSHILPEGGYINLSAEPENIIALCASCHSLGANSWHESPLEQEWFHKKFPGLYQKLKDLDNKSRRHKIDYCEKHKKLKQKLNEMGN